MTTKQSKIMDEEINDTDTIIIELGVELSQEEYDEVVASVVAFMNARWPQFSKNVFAKS